MGSSCWSSDVCSSDLRVPGRRGGIYEVAERVVGLRPEGEKEACGEAGRPAGVGLRLALVGQDGVEDVGAKGGLGDVARGLVFVAEQAVQPAVGLAARGEVVDQLHVAPFAASAVEEVLEVDEGRVVARQLAQWPATDLAAFGVVGVERDRTVLLRSEEHTS